MTPERLKEIEQNSDLSGNSWRKIDELIAEVRRLQRENADLQAQIGELKRESAELEWSANAR